jgi:hypothetical protein
VGSGNQEPIRSFNVGELVYLRTDTIQERIWKIRNIGSTFITIETDNINNVDETIKVVLPTEIIKVNEINKSNKVIDNSIVREPIQNGGGKIPQNAQQTQPVFNIKFVNGSENNSGIPPSINSQNDIANTTQNSSFNETAQFPIMTKTGETKPMTTNKPPDTTGAIDFSKLVIVKK